MIFFENDDIEEKNISSLEDEILASLDEDDKKDKSEKEERVKDSEPQEQVRKGEGFSHSEHEKTEHDHKDKHNHESYKDLIVKLAGYKKEIEELKEKLAKALEEKDKNYNSMLLIKADSENYKKRVDKDTQLAVAYANKSIIKDLLPALDAIDVAVKSLEDEKSREGVLMIKDSIFQALSKHGLEKIEAKEGDDFDPEIHEACLFEDEEGLESEKVKEELSVGYRLNGKILRSSKVKVARPKTE